MHPVPSPMTLAFDLSGGSRHFQSPTLRFSWEGSYRDLLTVRSRYDLSTCSPPLSEPTRPFPQPTEAFTSGLSTAWSPAPSPGITTGATGQAPRGRDRAEARAPRRRDQVTFPRAPLQSRKVGFPDSGFDLGFPREVFPRLMELKRSLTCTPTHFGLPRGSS